MGDVISFPAPRERESREAWRRRCEAYEKTRAAAVAARAADRAADPTPRRHLRAT